MKKFLTFVVVLIVAGAVWWFASPLFLSTTVDEEFPTLVEQESPTLEEIEQMTSEEKDEIQDEMMEHAAALPPTVVAEEMPDNSGPTLLSSGTFVGADSFHQGSGTVGVYTLADGSNIVRFEDFSVTNGPDLRVLLATGDNPTDKDSLGEYIELGKLKGNAGNQNYEIPLDVDISEYGSVVIYCKPFSVVFSKARLQ